MTIINKLCWTAVASTAAAIALGVYIGEPAAQASNQNLEAQPKAQAAKAPKTSPALPKSERVKTKNTNAAKIDWQPDFATAQRVAAQNDKPLMIVFGATWCGACQSLKKNTLTNARVVEAAQQWVTVEVDVDQDKKLAAQYGIESLPTTVFFKGDSKKLGFVGAAGPDDLLKVMQTAYTKIEGAPPTQS